MLVMFLTAVAAASVAVTITWSRIFLSVRSWLQAYFPDSPVSNLFQCYYCMGHWFALFFYWLVAPNVITFQHPIPTFLVNYFALVGVTSIIGTLMMVMLHVYKWLVTRAD